MTTFKQYFCTDDGVKLYYEYSVPSSSGATGIQDGDSSEDKEVVLILPGWSQTTKQYSAFVNALLATKKYHVIGLHHRGHGHSEKPPSGYRVSRMAKDLLNLLEHLKQDKSIKVHHVIGHSASVDIVLNFIELFGWEPYFQSFVAVDKCASIFRHPEWTDDEARNYGSFTTPDEALKMYQQMLDPVDGDGAVRGFLQSMFSSEFDVNEIDAVIWKNEAELLPRKASMEMLWNVMSGDYRSLLPQITIPTLCIGGEESTLGLQSIQWEAEQMPKGEFVALPGGHFMFVEHPEPFNKAVLSFLEKQKVVKKES